MRSSSVVLLALELRDRAAQRVAVRGQGVGVPPGVSGLGLGERRLRDQGPQPGVLGLLLEERELLLGDRELGAQALEPVADVDEAPLERSTRPRRAVYGPVWTGPRRGRVRPGQNCRRRDAATRSSRAEHEELRASGPPLRRHRGAAARRRVGGRRLLPRRRVPALRRARLPRAALPRAAGAAPAATSRPGLVFVEELARCGAGAIPMAISVQTHMCTPALAEFGTDDQRERWLAARDRGRRRSARSRSPSPTPAPTSPRSAPAPCATATSGVINGRKMFITNGTRAHFLTLVAKTDPGSRATAACRCSSSTPTLPGVSVSRKLEKLGMHSSDTAEIALDDVRVPAREPHRRRTRARASRS